MTKVKCNDDICKFNKHSKKFGQYCKRKLIILSVHWGEMECNSFKPIERILQEEPLPEFDDYGHF